MRSTRLFRRRPLLMWLGLILSVTSQFVIAGISPFAEARAGQSAGAHVEAGGVSLHHAHDETACPSCAAQQLLLAHLGRTPAAQLRPIETRATAPRPLAVIRLAGRHTPSAPRAPPSLNPRTA